MIAGQKTPEGQLYVLAGPPTDPHTLVGGIALSPIGQVFYAGGVAPPTFSPADLFANGEEGAWYDPSDFSTMFQDTTATTPVTAVGQSVGRINDKSGRGNDATAPNAASRPVLRQDANSKYYLEFDGVDDNVTSSITAEWAPPFEYFAGYQVSVGGGIDHCLFARVATPGSVSTSDSVAGIFQRSDVVQRIVPSSRIGSGAANTFNIDSAFEVGGPPELAIVSSTLSPDTLYGESNGLTNSITPDNLGTLGNVMFSMSTINASANIRMYSALAINRVLSAQETTDLTAWINEKAGI